MVGARSFATSLLLGPEYQIIDIKTG